MAKVAPIETAYNTGEISPLMDGRVDFDRYKAALKVCLNHIPLVQGGVTRRPGTIHVAEVKDSNAKTRLVRFEYSVTQAYVLEFGNLYVRIYRNHGRNESPPGTPIEVVTPYTTAQIPYLMFTQSADVLYIAHPSHPPASINRASDTSWSYNVLAFVDGPYQNINATATTLTFGANTGTGVTCASSTAIFASTDVGRHIRAQLTSGAWGWAKIASYVDASNVTVDFVEPLGVSTSITTVNTSNIITVPDPEGVFVGQPVTAAGIPGGTTVVAVAGSQVTLSANATASATVTGAFSGTSLVTDTWRLGLWSATTGYPACVTFFQDRLCWGGCTANPESLQLSVTGNYLSHQPTAYDSLGTVIDSYALNITLSSNDVQNVRWMSGDSSGLLVGTTSGEWTVSPTTLGGALTPTNLNAVQMTSYGSAQIRAAKVGSVTLMVQRSGRKVREMTYVYYENKYRAPDLTVLAQHITRGGITEIAYQQEPNSVLWAVRSDGVLLGLTYERDQNVIGWHRHELGGDGIVESVASIPAPDGTRDELWLIVKRTIGGVTKRYVEYMTKMWERGDAQETAVYLDSALVYSGAATDTVAGASHLIGETVGVLADGALHPDCVVDGSGNVELNREASDIIIGKRYNSDGQTLRPEAGAANGTAQGKTQRTHRVTFRLHDALGLQVGPDFDTLTPRIVRSTATPAGQMVPLFSGDDSDTWEGDYTLENLVCWRFSDPFPGTLLAHMPQLSTFDR